MVKGVFLTRGDYSVVDDVTYDFPWQTETPFSESAIGDFWTVGVDNQIILPADGSASRYQIFWGAKADTPSGNSYYMGPIGTNINWYGIQAEPRYWARPGRSAVVPYTAANTARLRFRSFGADHRTFQAAFSHLACIVDPVPIAIAASNREARDTATEPNSWGVYVPTPGTFIDPQSLHDGSGGFVAPAGAEAVCVSWIKQHNGSFNAADYYCKVSVNDVDKAYFAHAGSARGQTPGSFGLQLVSPGDVVKILHQGTTARTSNVAFSVEFY